jgi:hypothetical protein
MFYKVMVRAAKKQRAAIIDTRAESKGEGKDDGDDESDAKEYKRDQKESK